MPEPHPTDLLKCVDCGATFQREDAERFEDENGIAYEVCPQCEGDYELAVTR